MDEKKLKVWVRWTEWDWHYTKEYKYKYLQGAGKLLGSINFWTTGEIYAQIYERTSATEPFTSEESAKAWVEQQLGATEDRTAELGEELAIASENLDIVHAQGVAAGKDIGRKELEEELAVYKAALNYAVRHILTGAGMSKERAQGILQEEVEAYIRLGKEHLLSFVKANAKR